MFCIDFEDGIVGTGGSDKPYIHNEGVEIVGSTPFGVCTSGAKCGRFDESRLEIPLFSNIYSGLDYLRITFNYMNTRTTDGLTGIISNDCFNQQSGKDGNSFYAACDLLNLLTGMKTSPDVDLQTVSTSAPLLPCSQLKLC